MSFKVPSNPNHSMILGSENVSNCYQGGLRGRDTVHRIISSRAIFKLQKI